MAVSTESGLGEDVITELKDDGVTETLRVVEGRAKFTAAGDDVMVTGIVEEGGEEQALVPSQSQSMP